MDLYMHLPLDVCTYVFPYFCKNVYVYIQTKYAVPACKYLYLLISISIYSNIYIYIYIDIHIYIYMCMCVCVRVRACL